MRLCRTLSFEMGDEEEIECRAGLLGPICFEQEARLAELCLFHRRTVAGGGGVVEGSLRRIPVSIEEGGLGAGQVIRRRRRGCCRWQRRGRRESCVAWGEGQRKGCVAAGRPGPAPQQG